VLARLFRRRRAHSGPELIEDVHPAWNVFSPDCERRVRTNGYADGASVVPSSRDGLAQVFITVKFCEHNCACRHFPRCDELPHT
jgi:hypothetical protein